MGQAFLPLPSLSIAAYLFLTEVPYLGPRLPDGPTFLVLGMANRLQ